MAKKHKNKQGNDGWRNKPPAPHALATELCLLKMKLMAAGLYVTAHKLEIAVKAIGWEVAANAADPPPGPVPPWMTGKGAKKKHLAQHARCCAEAKRTAWKELHKLPEPPI